MPGSPSTSPPSKKTRLEKNESMSQTKDDCDENSEDNCSICLQPKDDRTVIPTCSHEFCFECLVIWTAQSRRCPLCTQAIGEYVIHSIRSQFDYGKYHLPPLRSSSPQPLQPLQSTAAIEARNTARRRRERQRERFQRERLDERDKLEMSIATRRWIYKHDLYAKHVASNSYTKYRPYPTPAQFAASPDLVSRTTTFLRRELQVWQGLDVEFLTNLIISLMKSIDIRSESAVKLLAEFLDMDAPYEPGNRHINAEHFAHEVYSYVRSPYRDLFVYDNVVQYDRPLDISPPPERRRHRTRWREQSRGRAESGERDGLRSPSRSPQQSGRREPHSNERRQGTKDQRRIRSDTAIGSVRGSPSSKTHRLDEPEASSSRVSSNEPRTESVQHIDHDSEFLNNHVPAPSVSMKGKERDNRVFSERTAQSPHRPSNGHQPGDAHAQRTLESLLMNPPPEINSRAVNLSDRGVHNPSISHVNRTENPKGKRKIDQLNSNSPRTPLFIDKPHAEIAASSCPRLPSDRQQSTVSDSGRRARPQPPRLRTLLDSVRAHLKAGSLMPQAINTISGDSVPSCHAFPGESSHYQARYHQRLSLLQRLSDPVTSPVDDQQSAQHCATGSHRQDENDSGTSALGLTSGNKSRATPCTRRTGEQVIPSHRNVIFSPLVSLDNELLCTEQRPSSLHDGHQDNSIEHIPDVTLSLSTSAMEDKRGASPNAILEIIPDDGTQSGTLTAQPDISLTSVPTRASDTGCINRVLRDREGRHQFDKPHVGSTPRPATATTTSIYTHGPPNSAPIMMHQDQSLRESLGSGLRAKLLFRLGEERKQACEALISKSTNSGLDTYVKEGEERRGRPIGSPMGSDSAPTSEVDRIDRISPKSDDKRLRRSMRDCRDLDGEGLDRASETVGMDMTALDAKLRARARLRAKLAAEKYLGEPM